MESALWHMTLATDNRFPLAETEAQLRNAVRLMGRVVGEHTLLFSLADDHMHLVIENRRREAGYTGRSLRKVMHLILPRQLNSARIRPVEDRSHLRNLLEYLLGQPTKHRLSTHPAVWSGSCFLELLGLRYTGAIGIPLTKYLPRLQATDIWRAVKLDEEKVSPLSDQEISLAGAQELVLAAARVTACEDDQLQGTHKHSCRARLMATALGKAAGIPCAELAQQMNMRERSIRRLMAKEFTQQELDAVRMLMGIQREIQRQGGYCNRDHGQTGEASIFR